MKLTLHIWRQKSAKEKGAMATYQVDHISPDMSFLEMLDTLNEQLILNSEEPVAFDHDCREGICGACALTVNGVPHGPEAQTTICQLHMRKFNDGDALYVEPWRARAFPVVKDLVVDRSAFDRIMAAGGFVSAHTGGVPDANAILIGKDAADKAMDYAACIGCGACVAACKNSSAMLFVGAKISQYAHLPQGQPERKRRALAMVAKMDEEGFGACTNLYECEAVCPKGISVAGIALMNRDFLRAKLTYVETKTGGA
ncbi:MAG: succinate dehydrogenase/fumarate reductase iron-sulfur subunit [Ignavibacteria bacterium]|nr:succinate dehydrogenase/fumarate reductase iron-sulfur subunit [Ignavibacteria bacterium]